MAVRKILFQSLAVLFVIVGVVILVYPAIWWFNNPENSQMMVLKTWWQLYFLGTLSLILATLIVYYTDVRKGGVQ